MPHIVGSLMLNRNALNESEDSTPEEGGKDHHQAEEWFHWS